MARRMIVFGIDGLVLPLTEHMVREGRLPNFARMFEEGAVTKVLPFVSTWGPINWMCLATGASPGTAWQGRVDMPGTVKRDGRKSPCPAEPLWQTLERCGRSSVVIAFPGCWPPAIEDGFIVVPDIGGMNLPPVELAPPARYMTPGLADKYRQPPGTRAGWIPLARRGLRDKEESLLATPNVPSGWSSVPEEGALVTSFCVRSPKGEPLCELGLLVSGSRKEAMVCDGKDGSQVLVHLSRGEWSEWVRRPFGTGGSEGFIRFKLLDMPNGGREVAFCHSQVYPVTGFAHPPSIEDQLLAAAGPYASRSSAELRPSDPFWETAIEEADYEGKWLLSATRHLSSLKDWGLFLTVFRPIDAANHGCLAFAHADSRHPSNREAGISMEILAQAYAVADRILEGFMDMADSDTVVAVASDHGAVVNEVTCDIFNLLAETGLLALEGREGRPAINWSNTKAYIRPSRTASEIFINLAGREPHGIVPPSEYEALQERIIDLLLDWREPETGRRAVALALKKRDSALLGYWGDAAGDIQFIYKSGFTWGELPPGQTIALTQVPSANHGPQIPTAEEGITSNMGMFALWGPGVKKGYRRCDRSQGPARMCDLAPTIAHLIGCDPPLNNEGAVLRNMLERRAS